jgi:metacaspase-1
MSWAFREAFDKNGFDQGYVQLLGNIRTVLSGKYQQIPQMSTGHRMDMNTKFNM